MSTRWRSRIGIVIWLVLALALLAALLGPLLPGVWR